MVFGLDFDYRIRSYKGIPMLVFTIFEKKRQKNITKYSEINLLEIFYLIVTKFPEKTETPENNNNRTYNLGTILEKIY